MCCAAADLCPGVGRSCLALAAGGMLGFPLTLQHPRGKRVGAGGAGRPPTSRAASPVRADGPQASAVRGARQRPLQSSPRCLWDPCRVKHFIPQMSQSEVSQAPPQAPALGGGRSSRCSSSSTSSPRRPRQRGQRRRAFLFCPVKEIGLPQAELPLGAHLLAGTRTPVPQACPAPRAP